MWLMLMWLCVFLCNFGGGQNTQFTCLGNLYALSALHMSLRAVPSSRKPQLFLLFLILSCPVITYYVSLLTLPAAKVPRIWAVLVLPLVPSRSMVGNTDPNLPNHNSAVNPDIWLILLKLIVAMILCYLGDIGIPLFTSCAML